MKTAIITGASRGIGKAIAEKFAEKGYNLALIARHNPELAQVGEKLKEAYGLQYAAVTCDIRNKEEVKAAFSAIAREFGGIEVLVNNAGINSRRILDTKDSENWMGNLDDNLAGWENEIATNLTGTYLCSYIAAGYMLNQGSGCIINISSVKGKEPTTSPGYGASKAGVIKLTRDFAKALAPYNIRVNCIAPGFINTGLTSELPEDKREKYRTQIPLGRFGDPKEIANVAAFLASSEASYITGVTIDVNGGYLMD